MKLISIFPHTGMVLTNPFDIVKTRLMAQDKAGGVLKYNGLFSSMATIVKEEGFMTLYKGLLPRLMRVPPGMVRPAKPSKSINTYSIHSFHHHTDIWLVLFSFETSLGPVLLALCFYAHWQKVLTLLPLDFSLFRPLPGLSKTSLYRPTSVIKANRMSGLIDIYLALCMCACSTAWRTVESLPILLFHSSTYHVK